MQQLAVGDHCRLNSLDTLFGVVRAIVASHEIRAYNQAHIIKSLQTGQSCPGAWVADKVSDAERWNPTAYQIVHSIIRFLGCAADIADID